MTFRKAAAGLALAALAAPAVTLSATPMAAARPLTADGPDTAPRLAPQRLLTDPRIKESSGLARSTYRRSVLFTHNDSGDSARFFAVSRRGATRAVLTLPGASARDWEDIAAGPGHRLWLGDIGDNGRSRSTISVYRVREPRNLRSRALAWTRYELRYADGRHDAEALLVHPRSGRLFVVSKARSGARIYRAPKTLSSRRVNLLRAVGRAPASVTAGAFGPGGRRLALSTYTAAYVYKGVRDTRWRRVRLPATRQGESLEFSRRGAALFRGSEGYDSPVYRVPLK